MTRDTNQQFIEALTEAPLDKLVYHYTRFDTALEQILTHRRLRMSPFSNVNDPRESSDWQFTPRDFGTRLGTRSVQRATLDKANDRLKRTWKVLALSTDDQTAPPASRNVLDRGFARPRMWAHYGGNHTGACLVFDRVEMIDEVGKQLAELSDNQWYSEPVRYSNDVDSAAVTISGKAIAAAGDVDTALREHQADQHVFLFFQKNRDWSTEYEYRFVAQRLRDPGYCFVDVARSLVGVILGERVSDVYGPSVDQAIGQAGVAAAQLTWRNGEPRIELPRWERPKWYEHD